MTTVIFIYLLILCWQLYLSHFFQYGSSSLCPLPGCLFSQRRLSSNRGWVLLVCHCPSYFSFHFWNFLEDTD